MKKITILLLQYCLFTNALPTNTSLGTFEIFANGIVPGIVSVLIPNTGKVVMIERRDGIAGTTHSQVVDVQSRGIRALTLPDDNFCSGGFITPDASARLYNLGNNNGIPSSIIQYIPCGTPGSSANDKCDWLDMQPMAKLQTGRWYPATLPMPNGEIAIFGGASSSVSTAVPENIPNAIPTLEWIPSKGPATNVQFLFDNIGWNLYPINFVLPDGSVFLLAGNSAAVVNPTNFGVIKTLPSNYVNGQAAFRTYPHGAGNVLLPLKALNGFKAEVLVCGGNTQNSASSQALTDCSRIEPLSSNPVWDQELMPGPRTMIDTVLLPDGTILMVNGAKNGAEGFNNYRTPDQTAWIYNPDAPKGSRFTVSGQSTIPRLYHSTALLLEDGRVMIAGSTPNVRSSYANQSYWPDETRIETYSPPYLLNGRTRPEIAIIMSTNWEYGHIIPIQLSDVPSENIKAVLFTNGFVTHTMHMGQRMIEMDGSISGEDARLLIFITPPNANVAPPGWYMLFIVDGGTPSVAKWIRLGNDPAKIASWPGDAPPDRQCRIPALSRKTCGDVSFTKNDCLTSRCCWDSASNTCFMGEGLCLTSSTLCDSTKSFDRNSCISAGCCWMFSGSPSVSSCVTKTFPESFATASLPPAPTIVPPGGDPPSKLTLACPSNTFEEKILCGSQLGESAETCAAASCCWSGSLCFKPAGTCDANLAVSSRIDCGRTLGTSATTCEAAGCCWGPLTVPGPWCFKPAVQITPPICSPTVAVNNRIDCGIENGRTSETCAAAGCCWSPLDVPGPWCYKGNLPVLPPTECMDLAVNLRADCGKIIGRTEESCRQGGCCWSPLAVPGPWCFREMAN